MSLPEFSTQASIEIRASVARVKLWADKDRDGSSDPAVLTAAFQYASGVISSYIIPRYGEIAFESLTIDTCPQALKSISDDLSIWFLASGLNAANPLISEIHASAIEDLKMFQDGSLSLYGLIAGDTDVSVTEEVENPFADTVYWNE